MSIFWWPRRDSSNHFSLTMSNPVEQVYSRRCTIATSLPRPVTNRFCNNLCSESDRNGETAEVLSWVATTIQLPWSPNSTSTNQWSLNCLRCFHGFSQTISTTSLSSKYIFWIPQSRALVSPHNTSPYFQSFRLAWFSQGGHCQRGKVTRHTNSRVLLILTPA